VNAYPSQSVLISFSPIYEPLRSLGYKPAQGSHADSILIEDVPVQFLVGNSLVDEAIDQAITVDLMGEPTEIVDLERCPLQEKIRRMLQLQANIRALRAAKQIAK